MMRPFGRPRIPVEMRALLIGYRWLILGSIVLVAALSDALHGTERWIVFGPILASAIMTLLLLSDRRLPLLALLELIAGIVLISVSGGPESPFMAYLTVPVVHVALRGRETDMVIMLGSVIAGLAIATSWAGGIGQFDLAIISEGTLLIALPVVLKLVALNAHPVPAGDGVRRLFLTDDDLDLLDHLATGQTHAAIAEQLDVSLETIKVRVARLYRRLGARNRTEAVALRASAATNRHRGNDRPSPGP